jgi:hypothetical protein
MQVIQICAAHLRVSGIGYERSIDGLAARVGNILGS